MIHIDSVTANGNEELANFVSGLLQDRGLKPRVQHVTHARDDLSKRQFNVIGILGDPLVDRKIRKGLLLNTHLDTVSPGLAENWTEVDGDPFNAVVKDGRIYGLGAADVKLDFLCKLHAMDRFRERKLKQPVYLVGTCGEEVGMFGVKYLIKSGALNPKFVVVGEPSDLKVVYAHKTLNIVKVHIGFQSVERDVRGFNRRVNLYGFGKSAHGSYPHLGVNAVSSMLEFLQAAVRTGFELRFTRFDGGDTVNKVPDRASAQFALTSHQFEDFKRFFQESVSRPEKDRSFQVELGGVGDAGVRFLPESIFPCLMEVMEFFRGIATDFEKVKDDSYAPAFSTVNCGRLRQDEAGLTLYFDLRILPDLSIEEIQSHLLQGIRNLAARYSNLNISLVRERMNPGLNMTLDHELVKICGEAMRAAGIDPVFDKKATSTEAAQYFQAGYESVVFGPGKSAGNSHSPNEHNLLEHLQRATLFYEKLIERVCL